MSTTTENPALRPVAAPAVPVLPDTAPFNTAQRAWLNGFFAGLLGGDGGGATAAAPTAAEAAAPAGAVAPVPVKLEEDHPWHDPALPMAERMKLAEGKPRDLAMMAAMAQLDCGACGYQCRTYAEALDRGEEGDATRCSPGGSETAKKLKELLAVLPPAKPANAAKPQAAVRPVTPPSAAARTYDKFNPFPARLIAATRLNAHGSEKDTRHVAFDLAGSGLTYKPGDALGVYPENCPTLVDRLLEGLDASGAEDVAAPDGSTVSLREALLRHYTITRPTRKLFELLKLRVPDDEAGAAPDERQVLDLLMSFEAKHPKPQRFVECLSPLQPRLYSIASSLLAHPDQVHLTVGVVRYVMACGRGCKGVCSTYLAERVRPGQKVRVFVHPSPRFGLPASADAPVIMVGPGTGVAPFRSFLQHRRAARHTGRNWLFFGDQRSRSDFLYESELNGYLADGTLTRLDTAFSRDTEHKLYVQHRMIEHATELWGWLAAGGHFYVCGDAKRMAADVDVTLRAIVAEQGRMSGADADAYVKAMTKTGRYQRDVY